MPLPFVKMHAHGDDFIIVDRRGLDDPITADIARRLGNRHTGIGFNQLAVVLDCEDAAARIKFWNPNGTPLATCGSATRGVADRLMHETGAESIVLRTDRGLLTCVRESGQRVSVNMGAPSLGWAAVPLAERALQQHVVLATSSQRPFTLAARLVAGLIPGLVRKVIVPLAEPPTRAVRGKA